MKWLPEKTKPYFPKTLLGMLSISLTVADCGGGSIICLVPTQMEGYYELTRATMGNTVQFSAGEYSCQEFVIRVVCLSGRVKPAAGRGYGFYQPHVLYQ